jgi:hypothetical protein
MNLSRMTFKISSCAPRRKYILSRGMFQSKEFTVIVREVTGKLKAGEGHDLIFF